MADIAARIGLPTADMVIIYDGQCILCSGYVKLMRLRASVGGVELVDARTADLARIVARELGVDLNEGMVVVYGRRWYHGAEAMTVLALLTSASGIFNRLIAVVFRSPPLSRAIYPILKIGRRITLSFLGRPTIDVGDSLTRRSS